LLRSSRITRYATAGIARRRHLVLRAQERVGDAGGKLRSVEPDGRTATRCACRTPPRRWPRAAACLFAALPALACDRVVGLTDNYYETYCGGRSPQPLLCEDFDESSYSDRVWSNTSSAAGTLEVDTTEYRSYPASLRAQSMVTPSMGTINVAAFQTFSLTGQTFAGTLDFDLRVDIEDSGCGQAVLAQIGLESPDHSYWLQFVVTSTGSGPLQCSLNEVGATNNAPNGVWTHTATKTFDTGSWQHVTLWVTAPLAGGPGKASLSFDGVQVASAPMIDVPVQNYQQTIGVGITWASTPSTGWKAFYDNVVFDGQGSM
jgi:hypothetical protein